MGRLPTLLKTAGFTVLVPGTVAVWIPELLARWRPHPRLPIRRRLGRHLGGLCIGLGTLLYAHTAFEFGKSSGTPSPTDEPDALVTGGVYRYSRNPMYIGVLLVVLGEAIRHRSPAILWWAAGCWLGFHNRIIRYEEPHLREKYGATYEEYCEDAPRWV